MPLSEADSRTVLLHLEVIRNIIRGSRDVPGDIRDVAAGFEPPAPGSTLKPYSLDDRIPDPFKPIDEQNPATGPAPRVVRADGSVEAFVEPDLDGGCAAEAAATASRGTKWVV